MTKLKPVSKIKPIAKPRLQLPKSPTGIQGLDEITGGGLPKGRPTLVCGGAGCGKTLLAMEFLVRGATEFDEPGVFMAFEENTKDLTQNVASLGFDLKDLVARKKIVLDFVYIERSEIEETGEYDLEGLFIRLGQPLMPSAPSAWCWIPSSRCSLACPIRLSCAPNCAACFAG